MATVNGDPARLWDLYSTIADARAEVDEECEDIFRSLGILLERMEETKKQIVKEMEGLEAELGAINSRIRAAEEEGCPTAALEAEKAAVAGRIRGLIEQQDDIKKSRKKAGSYKESLARDKKECIDSLRTGGRRVNKYIKLLEDMLLDQDYQEYQASAGSGVRGNHGGQYRSMTFRGIMFYCSDAALDIEAKDGRGRTNLERMERGLAPVGADGLPVNLHHMQQSAMGTIMELSETRHKQNHQQLHPNTSDIPSGINRSTFTILKGAYWRRRAAFIKRSQGK